MKRILSMLLMTVLVLSLLAACGGGDPDGNAAAPAGKGAFDPAAVKTMEDVFPYEDPDQQHEGFTEKHYVFVFRADGNWYRAVADLPQDVSDTVWAIDFFDENRDQKIRDLVSPLAVRSLENLSEQIPAQEELDRYIGKTGRDLFDEGWTYWYYNLDDLEAGLEHGPFRYRVLFEYEGEPMVNSDDFDFYEEFRDLVVLSVTYDGIGDATDIMEELG